MGREMLEAQAEYRKHNMDVLAAQQNVDLVRLAELPLWRIRTRLQKLMAEKMSDFASFKRN